MATRLITLGSLELLGDFFQQIYFPMEVKKKPLLSKPVATYIGKSDLSCSGHLGIFSFELQVCSSL